MVSTCSSTGRLAWLLPRLLIGLLLLSPGALLLWKWTRHPTASTAATPAADPRLTDQSPYRNVRPDVKYVGDAACVGCHEDIAKTYRHHPMSRSLTPIQQASKWERAGKVVSRELQDLPVNITVTAEGGRMTHAVRGGSSQSTLSHSDEIRFLLGSGSRGQSALIDHDGLLFQSPLSWFSKVKAWGPAPGYGASLNFDRPVQPACLFCHANRARPVAGTLNRYHEPVLDGFGIGCERCHGPGQLHVERQSRGEAGDGPDDTIVNPAKLPPALREPVCQQCHLTGTIRVPRAGRGIDDYRPGLPLHEFWATFVQPRDLTDNKAIGQVEQMYSSRCFQASKGKLGCISCHNPHVKPAENEKVAYYRNRCLQCHTVQSCKLSLADRHRQSPQDNCIKCHMPRSPSSDFAHTAATDHRIPRKLGEPRRSELSLARATGLLVNFHRDLLDPHDPGARRDLGVGLMLAGRIGELPREQAARAAWPLLSHVAPDDVAGRDARAWALWMSGRREAALTEAQSALESSPDDELLVRAAGTFSARLQHNEEAVGYLRRVLAFNPYDAAFHEILASVLARMGKWAEVEKECRLALQTNLTNTAARRLLVRSLLAQGHADQARAEQDILQTMPEH